MIESIHFLIDKNGIGLKFHLDKIQNKEINTIHDSKILNYNIDFERSKIEIKAMTEKEKQIKILFEDFFAYYFENKLSNSILLEIVEGDVNSFALDKKKC